jgi:hypothetical protein
LDLCVRSVAVSGVSVTRPLSSASLDAQVEGDLTRSVCVRSC